MYPFCKYKTSTVVVVVALVFPLTAGAEIPRGPSNGECESPVGGRGICRNINDCKPIVNLLIKGKSRPRPWVLEFLKKSHCGFEGKDPIVCCPITVKPKETRETTTTKEPPVEVFFNRSCGVIRTLDKIIGGSLTSLHEFPWMVLIGYKTKYGIQFRCGGSLISPRYVLTAAHCVTALKDIIPTSVRLGEYDLGSREDCKTGKGCGPPAEDVDIEELIPHPDYFKLELRNDIALIRMTKNVKMRESIRPICLPLDQDFRERSLSNDKAVVAGWGTTDAGTNSQVLRKVTLPIVSLAECSKVYRRRVPITDSQICAGGESGKDSCSGDSGGPLQIVDLDASGEPVYVQHGIVSFGPRNCGTKGIPGVYTKVANYVDWILNTVKE